MQTQNNQFTKRYLAILKQVLHTGFVHQNTLAQTGVNFFLSAKDVPILSCRKVHYQGALAELMWILSGSNVVYELGKYAKYWQASANDNGKIPMAYGTYFRHYPDGTPVGFDQLKAFCTSVALHPTSRRHQLNLWHPPEALNSQNLPPCLSGLGMICYRTTEGYNCTISIKMRSSDLMLGFVFDTFQYFILGQLICNWASFTTGEKYTLTNYQFYADVAHIYNAHLSEAKRMVENGFIKPSKPVGLSVGPYATPFYFVPSHHVTVHKPKYAPRYNLPLITKDGPVA
jgi:thymidylate synthase